MERAGLSFSIRSILSKAHNSDSVYCGSSSSENTNPNNRRRDQVACTNDDDCPRTQECVNGACITPTPGETIVIDI